MAAKAGDAPASMSREQGFLEAYFQAIAQFSYDKAKQLAEKEKEAIKSHVGSLWNSMLSIFAQLATAEKLYMSLCFLGSKGFLRKDNSMRQAYDSVVNELVKAYEAGKFSAVDSPEKMIADLCARLGDYMHIRMLLTDFYEKIHGLGTVRRVCCGHLFELATNMANTNRSTEQHPYLMLLKTYFSYECDTLALLFHAQQEMEKWSFLSSLTPLCTAHAKLAEWAAFSQFKESRRLSFGPGFLKPQQLPPLYQWLVKYKVFLATKFSLYFHEILSKQTNPQEMKSLCSKSTVDLYHKMSTFQRKSDALYVGLVYGIIEDDDFKGHGYHHPASAVDQPKSMNDSYIAVVGCPGEKPTMHWQNLIMTIDDRLHELASMERVVCSHEKELQCTFMIIKVEYKVHFVAIFNGKRSEKESYITTFIEDICSQLRIHRILLALKPGNK